MSIAISVDLLEVVTVQVGHLVNAYEIIEERITSDGSTRILSDDETRLIANGTGYAESTLIDLGKDQITVILE